MNRKMSALNITGANSKVVAKEVFNSFYELTKIGKEPSKAVPTAIVESLLSISPNDITKTYLLNLFANTTSSDNPSGIRKSICQTWDTMTVPTNHFYSGQPEIHTTIGRYIANKFLIHSIGMMMKIGFLNKVFNQSGLSELDETIGLLYTNDDIDRHLFNSYLDHRDTLGYWLNGMLAHTISEKMYKPLPEIEKKKAELIAKYKDEIEKKNIDVMTKISDELIAYAKEVLKDDPGMDLYTSGDLDFGNNYKNNSIIKGAVMNNLTGEYDFIDTSFMDGIQVKDIPAHANSILASQFPASIETAASGYMAKKLIALLQMMDVDVPGSDCGTKNLIPILITKVNKKDVLYRWIQDGDKLIQLTPDNISKYIDKRVPFRSPMSCIGDKLCSKCAGEMFYKLGVEHAGLFASALSHAALNLGLKAKHNSVVSLYTIDPESIIEDI